MNFGALSRLAARAATALAVALGLALFLLEIKAQAVRLALYMHHGLGFTDPDCSTGYCDYGVFWLAGFSARHGGAALLYSPADFAAQAVRVLGLHGYWWPFVYPPVMLVPAWGISLLPFVPGYYVVSALLLAASVKLLRAAKLPWWCVAAGMLSFPAMWTLYLGQFGLICGALLYYGLSAMPNRPWRAGAALGLLLIKPQFTLLVPAAVLAGRHWRVLLAGVAVVLLLLGLATTIGGLAGWRAYLGPGREAAKLLLERPFPAFYENMGTSVFWALRSLHGGLHLAYAGQALAIAVSFAGTWALWRRPGRHVVPASIFLTLLANPYGYTDYLAIYSAMLPLLADKAAPWRNALLAWLWVAPAFVPKFVAYFGVLPTPLLLLAALALCFAEQKQPLFAEQIGKPA